MQLVTHLYAEPAWPNLDVEELARYLRSLAPTEVEVRGSFFSHFPIAEEEVDSLAQGFALAKIRNPLKEHDDFLPLYGEVQYEWRRLTSPKQPVGITYHGEKTMVLCRERLPREERSLEHLHIIFTNQLLATWESGRYHFRVAVFGFPCFISTSGLIEAPARPREYYLLKQQYSSLGMDDAAAVLEGDFPDRLLLPTDPRITEVMKGYVMQALFHHLTGDPFCPDPGCRLYNAHWQEEVIAAQLKGGQFCPAHERQLEVWRNGKGELVANHPS